MKILRFLAALLLPAAVVLAQQPVTLQRTSANDTSPNRLTSTSKTFIVPSTGSITADPGGIIAATSLPAVSVNTTSPLLGGGALSASLTLSIQQSSATLDGFLSHTDWNTFNGKQPAGNYLTALTGDVTATGPGSAAATVKGLNGTLLSGLTTGLIFNTTTTGVPGIAGLVGLTFSSGTLTVSAGAGLPSQTGNANKLLQTNGTTASWVTAPVVSGGTGATTLGTANNILTGNGTSAVSSTGATMGLTGNLLTFAGGSSVGDSSGIMTFTSTYSGAGGGAVFKMLNSSVPTSSAISFVLGNTNSANNAFSTTFNYVGAGSTSNYASLNVQAIAENIYADGHVAFPAGIASTNTSSGTVVITGGEGISGALNVGGTGTFGGTAQAVAFFTNTSNSVGSQSATYAALVANSTYGAIVQGFGTTADFAVFNKSATLAAYVPTGTANFVVQGNLSTTSGLITQNGTGANTFGGTLGNNSISVSRTTTSPSTIALNAFTSTGTLAYTSDTAGSVDYGLVAVNGSNILQIWHSGLSAITAVAGSGLSIAGGLYADNTVTVSGTSALVTALGTTTADANVDYQMFSSSTTKGWRIRAASSGGGNTLQLVANNNGTESLIAYYGFGTASTGLTVNSTASGTSTTAAAILGKSLGLTENEYIGGTLNVTGTSNLGIVNAGSSSTTNVTPLTIGDSSLLASNALTIQFGVNGSTNNQGQLSFNYAGAGSASNYIGFGFTGVGVVASLTPGGALGINGNLSLSGTNGTVQSTTSNLIVSSANTLYLRSGSASYAVNIADNSAAPVNIGSSGSLITSVGSFKVGSTGTSYSLQRRTSVTLVAGTKAVTDSAITASSQIGIYSVTPSGTVGSYTVSVKTAGSGYTIVSSNNADTSTVVAVITEP